MRRRIFAALFFVFSTYFCSAQSSVILRVRADEQEDTLGVNIVREITKVTYEALRNGKAVLWDSPKKEVQISFNSLNEIEKSAALNFVDQQLVFVYEIWNYDKKKLTSQTLGFLFTNQLTNGEAVVFGYVEYDSLINSFATASPYINADGDCYMNINDFLKKKKYNYQVLQLGSKVANNLADSKLLRDEFTKGNSFNYTPPTGENYESKYLEWKIVDSDKLNGSKAKASLQFINSLTNYFRENIEVLYNLSGKNAETILQNGTWKITNVSFAEVWKKYQSGIATTPLWMSVVIDSTVIDTLWMDNLVNWDFKIDSLNWLDFITQKNYLYTVTKINSEVVSIDRSYKFQKALFNHRWNNLINYVQNY